MESGYDSGAELHAAAHGAVRVGIRGRQVFVRLGWFRCLLVLHHSAIMNRCSSPVAYLAAAIFMTFHRGMCRNKRAQQPDDSRNGEKATHNDRRDYILRAFPRQAAT